MERNETKLLQIVSIMLALWTAQEKRTHGVCRKSLWDKVAKVGLEPTLPCGNRILRLAFALFDAIVNHCVFAISSAYFWVYTP